MGGNLAAVLSECFYFVLSIGLGFFLKRAGIFKKEDGDVLSKVIVYITLPCAILSSTSEIEISVLTFEMMGAALVLNILLMGMGYIAAGKRDLKTKAAYMINTSGYNVGCFALPFIESFFPGAGVSYLCMFDTGNAIMGLGGIFSIANSVACGEKRLHIVDLIKTVLHSVCFDTYMIIFILSIFHIKLPPIITGAAGMIGKGNAFLTMLMIGILLEIRIPKEEIRDVYAVLGMRILLNLILGGLLYLFFPVPLLARKILLMTLVCPPASVAVVFTKMCGYKKDMPAIVSSLNIVVSMIEMVILLTVLAP